MRFRRIVIGLLGVAAALAAALPLIVVAVPPGAVLPDLVADPPAFPAFQNYTYPDGTQARLLRFDGYVHNRGNGPFEIRGSARSGSEFQTVRQYVQTPTGLQPTDPPTPGNLPRVIFETADQHNHFHLMRIARYSLWNSARTAEVAPGQKVGFCLEDTTRIETNGPSQIVYANSNFCHQGNPSAADIKMGVSAGWRDRYGASLALQWVDVSDVQPGSYWLAADIDTENVVVESDEANVRAFASSGSTVAGYRATAVNAGALPAGQASTITLTSQTFGTPGARQFRIESLPAGGTLRNGSTVLAVGSTISTSTLTYTPNSGFGGPDGFTFSARDSTSQFPRTPAAAEVSLTVGQAPATTVAISGAPASMNIGTSVQLSATVTNGAQGVSWAAGGVTGGNATVGTISASGLYQAPAAVPAGGSVTVRATSTAAPSAFDEKTIQIVNPGPPDPAPDPGANYVRNPSFESNLTNWTASQASLARTQLADAPNGVWVARVTRSSGTSFTIDDTPASVDPTVASTYTGAAFVKAASTNAVGKFVRVNLRERTPAGATVRNVQGPTLALTNAFQRVSAQVTAAAGNRLEIYVSFISAVSGNAFYVDQISLTNGGVGPSPNEPPIAAFTASTLSPQTGQLVTFTDGSSDPDGTIVNREWDLDGDGAFDDATGPTATRTYTVGGDVLVRVRVTDNKGASATASRTVAVQGAPGPGPGTNLVANGSFETSVSGWTTWQGSLLREQLADAPAGSWAVKVSRVAGTAYTIDDSPTTVTSAQGGATYRGAAFVKAASPSAVGKEMELFLRERTAGGATVRNVAGPSFFLTNAFQEITAQLVPQAAGNQIEIYVSAKQAVAGDAFYLDKVSLGTG